MPREVTVALVQMALNMISELYSGKRVAFSVDRYVPPQLDLCRKSWARV